ncbi:hypothetical protein OGQ07_002360 [Morganella morganii]
MDIYTYPKSRSIRATWMAEELGLDYQCHFTDVMSAECSAARNSALSGAKFCTARNGEISAFCTVQN